MTLCSPALPLLPLALHPQDGQEIARTLLDAASNLSTAQWFWILVGLLTPWLLPRAMGSYRIIPVILGVGLAFLPPSLVVLLTLVCLTALLLRFGVSRVPEGNVAVVERLGKYHRTFSPGLNILVPGLEAVVKPTKTNRHYGLITFEYSAGAKSELKMIASTARDIDEAEARKIAPEAKPMITKEGFISTRETILDPEEMEGICSDNTVVHVDSIVYFQIIEAEKALYNVEHLGDAIRNLVATILRQETGKLDADGVVRSRDVIGTAIQRALEIAAEPWGTRIVRVEIESIVFKDAVREALERSRQQELEGRGKVVEAERKRDAVIAEAEGVKQAEILQAEGKFEAMRLEAEGQFLLKSRELEGEAQGLRAKVEALRGAPHALVDIEALRAQEKVAAGLGQSDALLVVPSEAAGLLGAAQSLVRGWAKMNGDDGAPEAPASPPPKPSSDR